jgi:hypothetical protein
MKMDDVMDKIPKPEVGHIKIIEIDKIMVPHPYCITPRHLTDESMYITRDTIRDAEKKHGAVCDHCRYLVKQGKQPRILTVDEHQDSFTLFLEVPKGDLNSIEGLKEYLLKIKPILADLKIDGIGFKQV